MKLKTLKDLRYFHDDEGLILHEPTLKAEAIKWVKECDKPYFERQYPFSELNGREECKAVQFIIKDRFNLTEEDLK